MLAPSAMLGGWLVAAMATLPAYAQTPAVTRLPTGQEVSGLTAPPALSAPRSRVTTSGYAAAVCGNFVPAGTPGAFQSVAFADANGKPLTAAVQDVLADVGKDAKGQPLTAALVGRVCEAAAAALGEAGYVAQVRLQRPGAPDDGVLALKVIAGTIKEVRVRGLPGKARTRLTGLLQRLSAMAPLNLKDAQRILLLANDVPGTLVTMELRPAPSGEPGQLIADIDLQRSQGQLVANVQNFGAAQVGRWSGLLRGDIYDLTGLADRTFLSAYSTSDARGLVVVQGGHDFAIGNDGLRMGLTGTMARTRPTLPNVPPGFYLASESYLLNFNVSYPLVRSLSRNLRMGAGLDYLDQNTAALGQTINRDRIRTGWFRLDGDVAAGSQGIANAPAWRLNGYLELRKGLSIFGATPRTASFGAVLPSRFEGNSQAFVARAGFGGEVRSVLDENKGLAVTVSADVRGQWTNSPLLAFEEFAVGNLTLGRGYDPGATAGDRMVGVATEFRLGRPVPRRRNEVAIEALAFYDHVELWNLDSNRFEEQRRLASVGGGFRLTWSDHVRLDVLYAKPLDKNLLIDMDKPPGRLLVSLTVRALPWR